MRLRFLPEDRERALRWLDHGVGLARDRFGGGSNYRHALWLLITESLDLLDRVPDQEKRWLSSGTRSGGWNAVGMTKHELVEIERLRVLSAMKPFEGQSRYMPQRNDVERSVGVLEWLRWCSKEDDHSLQKAVVLLAKGAEDEAAKVLNKHGRTRIRQVSYEIRTRALGRILKGLREDAGIIPSPNGQGFVEAHHGETN
ncbi:hypothetical protein [Methylobacterium sp. WL120]|uniref:hypothetical protein n=1 Tax=Methylobacterium sp. WL120 TaxID=2603887 RepID=UPI0011C72E89|nr:hypothetical protein [Methylobacterium sp. WL120]TXM69626.1 hypothetical protein FV229_04595 [Methylobacterium sp. WL120]